MKGGVRREWLVGVMYFWFDPSSYWFLSLLGSGGGGLKISANEE